MRLPEVDGGGGTEVEGSGCTPIHFGEAKDLEALTTETSGPHHQNPQVNEQYENTGEEEWKGEAGKDGVQGQGSVEGI
jgi:hypothetical protein